jgi:uncharacterized protein DUF2188
MSRRQPVGPARRRPGPNVWVIRYEHDYSVKEEGSHVCLVPPVSQREAIAIARRIAQANRSELIIQGREGRIVSRDSHGHDPRRSRG